MSNSHGGAGSSPRNDLGAQLEWLERREMPAVLNFDFGTATSPVASGYTGVPVVAYTPNLGFGWQSTTGIQAVDYGGTNPLTRDVQTGHDGTFLVDVPNGQYDVAVTLGDPKTARKDVTATADGSTIVSNLSTLAGQLLEGRGRVTVTDGQLTLHLTDGAGANAKFAIAALTVSSVDSSADGLWASTVKPGTAAWNDSSAVEVGTKFQSSVDGTVSGVQFYKGNGNTGTHTGSLWTADGKLLATVTFANETSSGWQTATFDKPVAITANTTYVVSYFAPKGHYAADNDYFTASGLQNGSLRALSDAEGGNGVYKYSSSSAFPNKSYKGTNYWVDVVFQPAGKTKTTTPTTSPPTADAGADLTANEGSAITFKGSATGTGLTYTWNFGDGTTASGTLTPKKTYADNGKYTVTLTVTDSLGRTATDTAVVTVNNVAPTATLSNSGPVTAGSPVTITFSNPYDPSSVDTAAGFKYSYDFNNDGTWEVVDSTATATTRFTTPGTYTVRGRITDKDGGFTDYTTTVTVTAAVTNTSPYPNALRTFYVSNGGSDSNDGSAASPWQTLQYAADNVQAGDLVIVKAGTYTGFQITTSGTAANNIVFYAESGVLVNAKQANVSAFSGAINLEGASYVVIDGFSVKMATYGTVRADIRSVSNTGAVIRNNTIDNASWWGILTGFSENVLIENNTVSNTQIQHGIYVGNSADNPVIRNNTVTNSHYCGIQINSDASQGGDGIITNALVEGNILTGNAIAGGASINFDGVQNSIIRNNVISGNRNGIALYQIDGAQAAKNNTVVGNTIVYTTGYFALQITDGSTGNSVFDNILYRTATSSYGSIGIDSASLSGFKSDYNIVVDRFNLDPAGDQPITFAQWQSQTGQDKHSILVSDPSTLFVDAANGNYRLKAGSVAIGAGVSLASLPTDILGNSRPTSGAIDIGAYEYGA